MKEKHILMYMRIAEAVAQTSSSLKMKVGSVIVKNNNIISTGYNAHPTNINGPLEDRVYYKDAPSFSSNKLMEQFPFCEGTRWYKLVTRDTVRHAEKNALLNLVKSNESACNSVMFCTHACCKMCAIDIVDAGIKKFYFKHNYRMDDGIKYLKDNGVDVFRIYVNSDGFDIAGV